MQQKQFPPTPKRLRDARRRGEVVHSAEVSGTVAFVVLLLALWALGGHAVQLLEGLWRHSGDADVFGSGIDRFDEVLLPRLQHAGGVVLVVCVAVCALAALCAAAGSFAQVGGVAAWSRLAPKASHLNPGAGLERVFSMRNVVNLAKMVVKSLLLAALLLVAIRAQLDDAARAGHLGAEGQLVVLARGLALLMGWASVIYAAMAAVDWLHQKHEFTKKLRMSLEDVRRELQESEGHETTRQRRRGEHHDAVFAGLEDRIARSTLAVGDAQLAVALGYHDARKPPLVMAMGRADAARRLVEAAARRGLMVVPDLELARALVRDGVPDRPAPGHLHTRLERLLQHALDPHATPLLEEDHA